MIETRVLELKWREWGVEYRRKGWFFWGEWRMVMRRFHGAYNTLKETRAFQDFNEAEQMAAAIAEHGASDEGYPCCSNFRGDD